MTSHLEWALLDSCKRLFISSVVIKRITLRGKWLSSIHLIILMFKEVSDLCNVKLILHNLFVCMRYLSRDSNDYYTEGEFG